MFGIFKKKPKVLPNFEYLGSYTNKDKYFVRTLQWDWLNKKEIHVFDNKSPRIITMDEWPQQVYLDADGQRTISEYIIWMANQFGNGKVPEDLDKNMIQTMEDLIKDGEMIRFIDVKTILPYYVNGPKSNQDLDKAYKLMVEDEYIKQK